MIHVLVLCTGNSCRSQMAEAYLRHFSKKGAQIYSAGVETHGLNPRAVAVLHEDGIDISAHRSKHVSELAHIDFDFVITVCDNARESCPFFPTKTRTLHQNFRDPAQTKGTEEEIERAFRETRDEIKAFCRRFAEQYLGT